MSINQMLYTSIFPDLLKIAKVTPIYKKDDETIFSNYRPSFLKKLYSFKHTSVFRGRNVSMMVDMHLEMDTPHHLQH